MKQFDMDQFKRTRPNAMWSLMTEHKTRCFGTDKLDVTHDCEVSPMAELTVIVKAITEQKRVGNEFKMR